MMNNQIWILGAVANTFEIVGHALGDLDSLDLWIVMGGILCAMSCALLGNFMLLRKMSMMGDAISHAVLPGIAGAFLFVTYLQSPAGMSWLPEVLRGWVEALDARSTVPMLIGAGVSGVLTTMFTQWVQRLGKVDQGAAMGVVFTTLFALGLIMIRQAADAVDLDPNCVLYGQIAMIDHTMVDFWGTEIPQPIVTLGVVFGIDAVCILLFYKELKITAFDPALADTLGISTGKMHYLLMILVALTTVASFEIIGSILVIAMLIVPAAASHLLTDRLSRMIGLSLILGAMSAVMGHLMAITLPEILFDVEDTSTSGMMAVASGLIFGAVVLGAPRYGLWVRWWHQKELVKRILREDILGMLFRVAESGGQPLEEQHFQEGLHESKRSVAGAIQRLMKKGMVRRQEPGVALTQEGEIHAKHLVRSHRLWEAFLEKHMALPESHLHSAAEQLEHVTSWQMASGLAESTGHPRVDPHGRGIPQDD